ncbi:MAG: primase C-terminal domain-containing protein [Chloroflexi bacterium]|nr:primase C-terminal domain-containing protein [Chloroflexota bacterium]
MAQENQTNFSQDILRRYFLGRLDAFATENRSEGGWTAVRKEIPDYLLENHLSGKTTVATYPVSSAGNTLWLCFDVDEKSDRAKGLLLWLHNWFSEKRILFLIEDTGGRGYHGWALFLCWVPAAKAVALANRSLSDYTTKEGSLPCSVEVFPKQTKPSDLGSAVRLPWGRHRSGKRGHFLSLNFEADDESAVELIQSSKKTTEFDLEAILPQFTRRAERQSLVAPAERCSEVIPEGRRHNTLLSLAGEFKAKGFLAQRILTELKLHNAQRCLPPLPDKEVEEIAKAVALKESERQTTSTKKRLTAKLPNLIDIVDNDGEVKYLILNEDGKTHVITEISREETFFIPPSREHLPFSLPRAGEVIRYLSSDDEHKLFTDLTAYFEKAAQLPSETHYKMISWWVLHTYLYEKFTYSPMLALVGIPERGKTRLGRAIISVAYRGLETETLREANLFRWSQDLGATIFLDVKDIWRKAEKEKSEDVLLKRYEKGGKVGRVLYPERGPFRDTVYFDIYGPTIIATNEPIHHILDTRCLPIIMPDAGQKVWPELNFGESLALKERLVAFRARHMITNLPDYPKPPLGRLGDIMQPLGMMMRLVSPVSPEEEKTFQELVRLFWLERLEEKAQSREARLIMAIEQCSDEGEIAVSEIAKVYNEGLEPRYQLSPDSIGRRLRSLGFKGERIGKSRTRMVTVDPQLLASLKLRWGLEFPEDITEPREKSVLSGHVPAQSCPQIQKMADTSGAEVSAKVVNPNQIQADTSDTLLQGDRIEIRRKLEVTSVVQKSVLSRQVSAELPQQPEAWVDYFLPDGTPVSCQELVRRWRKLGYPQVSIGSGKGTTNLEAWLENDVDLEDLSIVVEFLNEKERAQSEDLSQKLGMSIKQALDIWKREGKPVIHLGPGENCFDLERLLSQVDINPRHLLVVKEWLTKYSPNLEKIQG